MKQSCSLNSFGFGGCIFVVINSIWVIVDTIFFLSTFYFSFQRQGAICIGNRIEWSTIQGVIGRVI